MHIRGIDGLSHRHTTPSRRLASTQRGHKGQRLCQTLQLAHRAFDPTGNAISQGRFKKIQAQIYVEHGVIGWLTLVGEVARSTDKTEAFGKQFTDTEFRRVEIGARAYLFTWEETLYSLDTIIALHAASRGDDPAAVVGQAKQSSESCTD
jgi:hypothetical protein